MRNGNKKTVICDFLPKMNLGLIITETLYARNIYWRHADVEDSTVVIRVLFPFPH